MSVFGALFSTGNPETDKLLDALERRYAAMKLTDRVTDSMFESEDEKLNREEKRLSIAEHKRALGLPYSDDDYENATNNGLSFTQKGAVAAFGKHLSDRIPAPGLLAAPAARGLMETRFPNKPAVGALDMLLSDGSILSKGAANVRKLRGIAKFFRR